MKTQAQLPGHQIAESLATYHQQHQASYLSYDAEKFCQGCGTSRETLAWMDQLTGAARREWAPYLAYHAQMCKKPGP